MTPTTTRTRLACLGLAAGLALSGCGGGPEEVPTPTTSSTPSTTAAPTTQESATDDVVQATTAEPQLSAEEQDQADVEETLKLYTRALDDAFNGEGSIEAIYPFSRDAAREKWVTQVMSDQAQGITSTGLTELEMVEVSVEEDTAEVTACADVSAVDVFDKDGDSILPADRLDRTVKEFVLERDASAEVGWYVVQDTNRNEPCDS